MRDTETGGKRLKRVHKDAVPSYRRVKCLSEGKRDVLNVGMSSKATVSMESMPIGDQNIIISCLTKRHGR